jgi:drug/metabolite transporter (DMT)-like permease
MAIHISALPYGTAGPQKAEGSSLTVPYAVAVLCWLLSAGVYIAVKWVALEMPPWTLCFWRVFIAWAILLPFVRHYFGPMAELLRTRALEVLIIGGLGLAICQGLIYTGLRYADATTAGIIMALMPIATMVLARIVLGEAMSLWQAIGSALALVGVVVIIAHGDLSALLRLDVNAGELWIVASALCWGLYTVLLRRAKFELARLPLLVLLLGAGALSALPFFLWELASGAHSAMDRSGLLALTYVAIPGGALMYYLFNWSVEALGASKASSLLYLQTVFVAVLAYVFLGESLHGYDLAGAAFIAAGLLLVTLVKARAPAAARSA